MRSIFRLDRWDVAVAGFLLLVTLLFHWPLITPNPDLRQSYSNGDFYDQFHAFASYEHDRLWKGELPLWNPYTFGGHPFLADVQAAVFYPLSLATMLLSGEGPFSPFWLEMEAIAHFYLAALFTYLFVRRVTSSDAGGPSRLGSLVAALTFAFGGYLTGYPPLQLAILETQIWLPLILLLLDLGLSERQWLPLVGAGVTWGVALLAGHPQSAMYVFYAALMYGLLISWRARLTWRWFLPAHLTWVGIGLGIAAIHLVPAWEFVQLSVRASASYEELAGGLAPRDLLQLIVPGAFTHWSPVYVGILPLFLALMACVRNWSRATPGSRSRSEVVFWAALALVSLVLALGGNTFVYRLFYYLVPGFNLFRCQERAAYLASFSLAVLAGYGWNRLFAGEEPVRGRGAVWATGGAALALVSGALIVRHWQVGFGTSVWVGRLIAWTTPVWAVWGVMDRPARQWPWWGILCVALVMVDLGTANLTTNLSPGPAESRVYDASWLAPVRKDLDLARMADEWGLPGNIGCWLRVQSLYGASPLRLQWHKAMAEALPHWRLWQLFGVRYVTTWQHEPDGPFAAERVAMLGVEWAKNTVYVHRLDADLPRAWIVHQARQASDLAALQELRDPTFDPYKQVLLSGPVPGGSKSTEPSRPATAAVVAYAPEEIVVEADLATPGWLVLGEWYYPGWQAWSAGVRLEILRADYGLRAVLLPAGVHRIVFRYRPASVYAGAAVSTIISIIVVAWVVRRCFRAWRGGGAEAWKAARADA